MIRDGLCSTLKSMKGVIKLHAQTSWYDRAGGGPEQRFIVEKLYVGDVSLQRHALSECVWLRLEIKQPHVSILKNTTSIHIWQSLCPT